jgi:hypothetical protein
MRYRQPQSSSKINWSNPLTKRLVFAYNAANPFYEVITRALGVDTVGPQTIGVGLHGRYVQTVSTYKRKFTGFTTGQQYTVLTVTTNPNGGNPIDSDDNSHRVFQFNFENFDPVAIVFDTAETVYRPKYNGNIAPLTTKIGVMALTVDANKLASVYINGLLGATQVTITGTPAAIQVADSVTINNITRSSDQPFTGQNYASFIWDRCLTQAEIISVSNNPWQLFADNKLILKPATGGTPFIAFPPNIVRQAVKRASYY